MSEQEFVCAKYPKADVSLNSHAYIDGFDDIPYEIVVQGPTIKGVYQGPIRLAVDCRSRDEAWAEAARKIRGGDDIARGPAWPA